MDHCTDRPPVPGIVHGEERHDEEVRSAPCGRRCARPRFRGDRRRLGRRRQETTSADGRPNAADGADEPAGHEPRPDERHARLGCVHGQLGELQLSVNKDGQGFTVPQGQTTFTIDWPQRRPDVHVLRDRRRQEPQHVREEQHLHASLRGGGERYGVAPPAPALSGHVRGPSQVRLTWNRVEDDTSEFVTYRVFADGGPGHPAPELVRRDGCRSAAPHALDDVPRSPSKRSSARRQRVDEATRGSR